MDVAQHNDQEQPKEALWAISAGREGAVFAFCSTHCRNNALSWYEKRHGERPETRQVYVLTCTWCASCGRIAYAPTEYCAFCVICPDERWEYTFNAVATISGISRRLHKATGDGRINDALIRLAAETAERTHSVNQVVDELWARRQEWADA
jgi:hypothetical protein